MRHRVHGRKLGRNSSHRKAMFRNQLTALFTHERIITTVAKAKELRPQAERMVTLARTGTLANRRRILASVPDREVVGRLFEEIAPRFADRPGGYTRIMRLGRRRGDGAELAIIEFVDYQPRSKDEGGASRKESLMDRAKGMFGGGRKDAEDEAIEAVDAAEGVDEIEDTEDAVTAAGVAAVAADELAEEATAEVVEATDELAEEATTEAVEAAEELAEEAAEEVEAIAEEALEDAEAVAEAADEEAAEGATDDEPAEEKKDD
jgi:large subunit ribosomal protein L17